MTAESASADGAPKSGFSAWAEARRDQFGMMLILLVGTLWSMALVKGPRYGCWAPS